MSGRKEEEQLALDQMPGWYSRHRDSSPQEDSPEAEEAEDPDRGTFDTLDTSGGWPQDHWDS